MADTDRFDRKCDECGQTDNHPHHIMYGAVTFADPITQKTVTDDRSVSRHLDCCHSDEHPCDHCQIVLSHAGDKRGLDLAEFVQSKPAELHADLRAAGFDVED